jgi:hypothetical protein
MEVKNAPTLPSPPRLIQSLTTGFDIVANHIGLILFPIFLDLFLWFGPRLSVKRLVDEIFSQIVAMPEMGMPDTVELLRLNQEIWMTVTERLNLFSFIRAYPIGVPSLMVSIQPVQTPVGEQIVWELFSLANLLLVFAGIVSIGLLAGTTYFLLLGQVTVPDSFNLRASLRKFPWALLQTVLMTGFLFVIIGALSLPGSCLLSVLALGGLSGGSVGLFIAAGFMIWLIFPLFFTPHGVFYYRKNVWLSIRDSIRISRYTLPTTVLFFLSAILINEGLDILWRTPAETSWFTLIGVAGHGYVTTSLLAASFVFYRDASVWVDRVVQQLILNAGK